MEYKIFVGKSLREAKQKMIMELGPNAYICRVREVVRSRFFGLRKQCLFEISAAKSTQKLRRKPKPLQVGEPSLLNYSSEVAGEPEVFLHSAFPSQLNQPYIQSRQNKLNRLQEALQQKSIESRRLGGASQPIRLATEQQQAQPFPSSPKDFVVGRSEPAANNPQKDVVGFLTSRDFVGEFAVELSRQMPGLDLRSPKGKEDLALLVANQFKYSGNATSSQMANPNLLFFVGPTGVGKTTTISKIASQFVLKKRKRIVVATFDTRRIMATAQLEKVAHILQVDFRVLREKRHFDELLSDFRNKDMAFIDTAGTGQRDQKHLDELAGFIQYLNCPKEVYLCLNASFRYKDLLSIAKAFSQVCYDRLLITKSDESYSLGSVLSLARANAIPLSFLTYGQEVPQDIELLSEDVLRERLLKEWS